MMALGIRPEGKRGVNKYLNLCNVIYKWSQRQSFILILNVEAFIVIFMGIQDSIWENTFFINNAALNMSLCSNIDTKSLNNTFIQQHRNICLLVTQQTVLYLWGITCLLNMYINFNNISLKESCNNDNACYSFICHNDLQENNKSFFNLTK